MSYSLKYKEGREKKFPSHREAIEWLNDCIARNPVAVLAPPEILFRGQKLDAIDREVVKLYKSNLESKC